MNTSETNRSGEIGSVPPRNSRFYEQNNYWFFVTREGASIGPFDTKDDAAKGVEDYIQFINNAKPDVLEFLVTAA